MAARPQARQPVIGAICTRHVGRGDRASALEVLGDSRFGEARTDFEAAHRQLRGGKGKEATRIMFPAVEVAGAAYLRWMIELCSE